MSRKICYVSGTRADLGLMRSTLQAIQQAQDLELAIIVTGMHLLEQYGKTVQDIVAAGLPVSACIDIDMEPPTGATMARNIGKMLTSFVDVLADIKPDLVLLLGDRGEMLAGALAAIHLNIPVAHIHGGERSGTIDEPVRHAISKLSHYHFTATHEARDRLIRMGEAAANVHVVGAPGLDGLAALACVDREVLLADMALEPQRPVALMVYHPVLQEAERAGFGAAHILNLLGGQGVQVVALKPNSDAGSQQIRQVLEERASDPGVRVVTHFPREQFISWMAAADFMIGNSSAGIIEAASFGTPVINIGSRQNLRERNINVTDVPVDASAIELAIAQTLVGGRYERRNIYGDGRSSTRIATLLKSISLDASVLTKTNVY